MKKKDVKVDITINKREHNRLHRNSGIYYMSCVYCAEWLTDSLAGKDEFTATAMSVKY